MLLSFHLSFFCLSHAIIFARSFYYRVDVEDGDLAVTVKVGAVNRSGALVTAVHRLKVLLFDERVDPVVELLVVREPLLIELVEAELFLAQVAGRAGPDLVMNALDAVAFGAVGFNEKRFGNDVFPMEVTGGTAVGAGFVGFDELLVFAGDVGPTHGAVLESAEFLFDEAIRLFLGGGAEGTTADDLRVLVEHQFADGTYITVGHRSKPLSITVRNCDYAKFH